MGAVWTEDGFEELHDWQPVIASHRRTANGTRKRNLRAFSMEDPTNLQLAGPFRIEISTLRLPARFSSFVLGYLGLALPKPKVLTREAATPCCCIHCATDW